MKCTYINLANATDRKEALETNFELHKSNGWSLERFEAVNTEYVRSAKIGGTARDTEKANYLSHKHALKSRLYDNQHYMVFEDDIVIGKSTCDYVDDVVKHLSTPWDIIYTEVCVPNEADMVTLIRLKYSIESGKITMLDLSKLIFAGATSFIINKDSKYKVYNLLDKNTIYQSAMDLYLRRWITEGKLKAFCIFPFITSFAKEASVSMNVLDHDKNTEHMWLTFRKLMWIDGKLSDFKEDLDLIANNMSDEESRAYATIFSGLLSRKYTSK